MESFIQLTFYGAIGMFGVVFLWFTTAYFRNHTSAGWGGQTLVNLHMTPIEEKRQHPRAEIHWPATIQTPQGPVEAKTKDISIGGAFVLCDHPFGSGDTFCMSLDVPDREPMDVTVQVAWSNTNVSDEKIVNRGMGVRFLQISIENRQFVHKVIEDYFEQHPK